ncbi:hypothetical protein ABIB56_000890 [Glaciihabitans sp. UYNi722]
MLLLTNPGPGPIPSGAVMGETHRASRARVDPTNIDLALAGNMIMIATFESSIRLADRDVR